MPLTDTTIKNFKPTGKLEKLGDGGSLFLHVQPNGTKRFVMTYRFDGKQRTLALGLYPTVSLKEARKRRDAARILLDQGIDPNQQKKNIKANKAVGLSSDFTFEAIAQSWYGYYKENKKEITVKRTWMLLDKYVLPGIGRRNIQEIARLELVKLLEPIIAQGYRETAEKTARIIGMVFDYAVNRGVMDYSVAQRLTSVVPVHKAEHRAAILDRKKFGQMLLDIEEDSSLSPSVQYCLRIMPYVFVRATELRCARWEEFDLENGEWHIPPERMKGELIKIDQPHFVPLARQVVDLLRELHTFSGSCDILFPSIGNRTRPISDGAMRVALRRLGYSKEEVSIHGFRSSASTFLHELGIESTIIERQLAHKDQNAVRAAYNHAEFKSERIAMMQRWADYLDDLKQTAYQTK